MCLETLHHQTVDCKCRTYESMQDVEEDFSNGALHPGQAQLGYHEIAGICSCALVKAPQAETVGSIFTS